MDVDEICKLAQGGAHAAVVTALHQNRDLVHKRDQSGRTVLHWSALGGNLDTVKLVLFNYGVDPDVCDELNWTPLIIATSAGKVEVVSVLLESGAYVNARNMTGQCALHYAASKNRLQIAEVLLKAGGDPNIADQYGATPLHRSASLGNTSITKLLLGYHSNPNAHNSEGNTPLHLACEEGRGADVRLLMDAGADLLSLNKEEKTPVMMATPDLRQILQNLEASPSESVQR